MSRKYEVGTAVLGRDGLKADRMVLTPERLDTVQYWIVQSLRSNYRLHLCHFFDIYGT